jgi:hypothetical protein
MALSLGNRVGRVGLEPTTYGLKVRYSAIELAPLAPKRSQLSGPMCTEYQTRGAAWGWVAAALVTGGDACVGRT